MKEIDLAFLAAAGAKIQVAQQPVLAMAASEERAQAPHLILQEELVAHVHDLVRRIDLVLGQAERGRFGLESALKDLRARMAALEERLRRG